MQNKRISDALLGQLLSQKFQNRFWSKIDILDKAHCWIWRRAKKGPNGYGEIGLWIAQQRITMNAHKVAWILDHKHDVPYGFLVLHTCIGRKDCCNPAHLKIGTKSENAIDCIKQRRHPRAKFTASTILLIRRKFLESTGLRTLAKQFGTTYENIRAIVYRRTWKHV